MQLATMKKMYGKIFYQGGWNKSACKVLLVLSDRNFEGWVQEEILSTLFDAI